MTIPASLPPLFDGWLHDLLGGPIPAETNATCDSCAMIVAGDTSGAPLADAGYNAETKCCTYLPELWNFLVGRVLLDDSPEAARGRATVEARLDSGVAVSPLGLRRDTAYRVLYATGGESIFGHAKAMRCPHYLHEEGGLCGVWRHRESTCATWFCKYVRGSVGRTFWMHLHQLLRFAEQSLAGWALLELGLEPRALARLYEPQRDWKPPHVTGRDVDKQADVAELRAVWGSWLGRERELYRECARLVSPLAWSDVRRICGAHGDVYARLVEEAYGNLMSEAAPAHPTAALIQITPRGDGRIRLTTYSASDAVELPAIVAAILPHFDGRPLAAAVDEIREQHGVTVDASLVRKLADFGVLKDADVAAPRMS